MSHRQVEIAPPSTDPVFTVLDVEAVAASAAPTLRFVMHVSDPSGREVVMAAMSVQVHIDPARRRYDAETMEALRELFGEPERWPATTHSFQWARVDVVLPGFTGATSFGVEVPCTYDLEVIWGRYLASLPDGEVPLSFHMSGSVFYRGADERLQVAQVPWSSSVRWRMPIDSYRAAIDALYPAGGWIRLSPATLDALGRRKGERGHHTYDDCVVDLLEGRA